MSAGGEAREKEPKNQFDSLSAAHKIRNFVLANTKLSSDSSGETTEKRAFLRSNSVRVSMVFDARRKKNMIKQKKRNNHREIMWTPTRDIPAKKKI